MTFAIPTLKLLFYAFVFYTIALTTNCGASEVSYKLGFGDRIRISIYKWDSLAGEYSVGVSGAVSMPLIGNVPVAGLEIKQVSDLISDRLQKQMNLADPPSTSVEMSQFRPFYILGGVEKPGDYPFRPGMIVLDALSIAGGFYRPTGTQIMQQAHDDLVLQGELDTAIAKLDRLYVLRVRLNAEEKEQTTISLPTELINHGQAESYSGLIADATAILQARVSSIEQKAAALDKSVELMNQEIATRSAQVLAIKEELVGLISEERNVHELVGKGVATISRQSNLDVTIADVKRAQSEAETEIIRARQSIIDIKQRKESIFSDNRNLVLSELADAKSQIDLTQRQAYTTQHLISESKINGNILGGGTSESSEGRTFSIVRRGAQGLMTFNVSELDSIQPGDIVKVGGPSTRPPS